jgi:predicted acyl esterase
MRDRYRSEGSGTYFHSATPHTGRDGYDIVEWVAAQPWSNGRVGTVGSSYAGQVQIRTALERPPHLTAIWPDVVTTSNYANCAREGGAMQGHMFWALFIHAQDAQDIADDPGKQQDVWNDLRDLRQLFRATPWQRGQTALRHVPPLEDSLIDYYTRGARDEYWNRVEHDYTLCWDQHADIPGTYSSGWYDPYCGADTDYYAAMAARKSRPQRLVIGPWSHVGMRGDATFCHDVDFGPQSVWGVKRYFAEQLEFFNRWLPDDATGQPPDEAPVRIFVMGGGSGRMTAEGKLDHGGGWREEREWPLARRLETPYYLHVDGSLSTSAPAAGAEPLTYTFDPAHPVPTLGGLYCSIGELPADGAGMEQAWARFLSPVLRLRDLLTPGPVDQKEDTRFFGSEPPYPRLSERPDVLVFQTVPLTEPVEVTGRMTVHLWISSSALDTDFTARLVDVHPANEDYPEGFDMLINDSVIRCRYREGFDREVFLTPGEVVPVTIELPPTSNVFDVGHRIRVDISSSNWPRLDVNPNTGEPMGRHTRQVVAEQAVYADADHPSHIVLPVIPS